MASDRNEEEDFLRESWERNREGFHPDCSLVR
jgi:hypothetical protein